MFLALAFFILGDSIAQVPPSDRGSCDLNVARYAPDPNNCSYFYQCGSGIWYHQKCSGDLYWNQAITNCDRPGNVNCPSVTPTTADPNSVLATTTTSSSTSTDPTTQTTTPFTPPADFVPCTAANNGAFASNPADCSTYYRCLGGNAVLGSCPEGLFWNNAIPNCDYKYNVYCPNPSAKGTVPPNTVNFAIPTPPPPPTLVPNNANVSAVPARPSSWTSGMKSVCYFTDWATYRKSPGNYTPLNIDKNLCTHVVYAFALLDAQTFCPYPADPWADLTTGYGLGYYQEVTSLRSAGIHVSLSIGGWNDCGTNKYSEMACDPTNRAKFVSCTVAFLEANNFNGVDIDWEYPACPNGDCNSGNPQDKQGFSYLMKDLRAALPEGYFLSAAVSGNVDRIATSYDVPALSAYLDWIGLMEYDYYTGGPGITGPIAPLYCWTEDSSVSPCLNVNDSIAAWIEAGASPNKLVMGIPLYGQSFTLTSPANNGFLAQSNAAGFAGPYTNQAGNLAYYEICSQRFTVVSAPNRMTAGPYAYLGNQWVSYDDVAMVTRKAQLAKTLGLGGLMVWALDMDDFMNICGTGRYPLLTAIVNVLKS